jgi:predicted ATP-grasp superfamily ATP-dependent carboligase
MMIDSSGDFPRESGSLQVADAIKQDTYRPPSGNRQLVYDALVLDAILKQSLTSVRSLGSRGLRVSALGTSDGLPTYSSRWCQQAFVCPAEEGTDEYLDYLEQVLEVNGTRVLITSSDATIDLIRRHRERLEQRVRIALAKEPALAIALDKERTLEFAKRLGVSIPRAVTIESENEVEVALHEIGLPAVVKPMQSWVLSNGQGMRLASKLVTTSDEARSMVEELASLGVKVVFQQYLSGRRESVSFLYADGQIYARCAQWHKRSQPPLGGQSVLRQSIAIPPDIGEQAERLVREIDLEGCSEAEFRRDEAGHPYLMEINPRLWASTELAVRAGVDFPYLLYQWASGEKIDTVKSYRVGGWLRYLRADITTTVTALEQRGRPEMASPAKTILDFCTSFFLPTAYDYVSWRDPLPAVRATASGASELARKIGESLKGTRKV